MSWDAIAALGVVFLAVGLLVRQLGSEKQACSKCEVVETQRRMNKAQLPPVVQKPLSELKLGRAVQAGQAPAGQAAPPRQAKAS